MIIAVIFSGKSKEKVVIRAVIFDVDGTLVDSDFRRRYHPSLQVLPAEEVLSAESLNFRAGRTYLKARSRLLEMRG